jgi:glycosyltransferase involved in cell wall biosynthesis
MTLPLISIVTPTLNQAGFIREAIDSVLAQEYPALEYLILDGGSTDGTLDILAAYTSNPSSDQALFKWRSAPDRGQTDAINRGWKESKGEILAWLNSDDFYYPGALRAVGEFFRDHPDVDLVYGDGLYVDAQGQALRPYPTSEYNYQVLIRETHNYIPQPSTFIRKRAFEAIGALDESLHYVMDLDCWMRVGLHGKGAYLPVRLAALRLHEGAKSVHRLGDFAHEMVKVYQRFFLRTDLPENIRRYERQSMSRIYLRAADCTFWAGRLSESRQYAWKSIQLAPLRPRRLWLYLLFGRYGYNLAQKHLVNPYL